MNEPNTFIIVTCDLLAQLTNHLNFTSLNALVERSTNQDHDTHKEIDTINQANKTIKSQLFVFHFYL